MPKMTHWNSPDVIDVAADKVAVYSAQGWVTGGGPAVKQPTAMTTSSLDVAPPKAAAQETAPAPTAKKAAKKSAKRAAKKS